jgi:hypothetical protein
MKYSVQFFEKVIKRHTRATIMALKVGIVFYGINISPCLIFVLLGISTNRASEVVEIRFDLFEFL